jgi:hypothetical protein
MGFGSNKYLLFIITLLISVTFLALPHQVFALGESYNDLQIDTMSNLMDKARDTNVKAIQAETVMVNYFRAAVLGGVVGDLIGVGSTANIAEGYKRSTLGQMVNVTTVLYGNPPAHLAYWVQDTGQALGFIHPAYAQGTGFVGLQPLLELWKIFRNAAYVLLALAIVILGFMIMFRRKIDPKTVLTVQNALPRVIMVLILITFSYAIAGFLIDLMYVIMYLVVSLFANAIELDPSTLMHHATAVQGLGVFGESNDLFAPLQIFNVNNSTTQLTGAVGGVLGGIFGGGAGAIPGAILGFLFGTIVSAVANPGTPGGIWSPILWLIFAIALVFTFFRIFFMLVTAYIQILIAVIIGPLQILLDVFPGTNAFVSWFMGLVSNLLTFLLVSVLMVIVTAVLNNIGTANLWVPPFIGGVDQGLLKAIIGIGGMIMIPGLVTSFKQSLKAQSAIPLGAGTALAPIGSAVGMVLPMVYQGTTIMSVFRHGKQDPHHPTVGQNPSKDMREGAKNPPV